MLKFKQSVKMLICHRALSCKLTSFVGQRNQIVHVDRRLTKFFSTSTALQKKDYKVPLKHIWSDVKLLTRPVCRKSIDFGNAVGKGYSTAPQISKVPIEAPDENKYSKPTVENKVDGSNKPTAEQLDNIHRTLEYDLPRVFIAPINYHIYRDDIEFINNHKGTVTLGRNEYIKQLLYLRVIAHVAYAYVKYDVIKITQHPEDNTVRVRWRIRGLSTMRVFTRFWKLKLTSIQKSMQQLEVWHDGFSTYYVDSKGLVYKHVADKLMPDEEIAPIKEKTNIAAKLTA